MSRIAGTMCRNDADADKALTDFMLAALQADASWASKVASAKKGVLGWCGWSSPNVAAVSRVLVVMDGYIYNRDDFGIADSDAHVLAELYAKNGFAEALLKINGDFAVALYDSKIDTLWLARDRFGIKPLYYVDTKDLFAFASRPSALLTLPGTQREVNQQFVALFAASHYRYFDNNPEQSPYANIKQLPAAHMMRLTRNDVTSRRYWSLAESGDFEEPESALAQGYRELLMDAVALRLRSARRPAFTLSGGMDSSSVLGSAVSLSGRKQHAFSAVYADKTYDESDEISSMLEQTKEWHRIPIGTPDVFGLIRRMIEVHDEPVATATWLSHFLLCEDAAKQGFGELFGGLGGDELNAGEYEYFLYHFADLRVAGDEQTLADEVQMWMHHHDHPIFRKNQKVVEEGFTRLIDLREPGKCLPDLKRLTRYQNVLNPEFFDLRGFEPIMERPFLSYLKNRTYQDITRETAPCCLRAEDRQAGAFNLHHFLPFFDHRLVEFMFRIPGTMKFREGVTKYLLREAMREVLPEDTRTRVKKTGWNAPAHVWFSGKGRDQLMDLVHSAEFQQRGIYNVTEVIRLINEHEEIVSSGVMVDNHMMFIWQLVNLELWLQSLSA